MGIWKKVKRMAEIKVPIQVNLPDDWVEQIVNRLRNDPDAEWVEVTRCKDCKHYGCILYSGTQFEYGECFGREESDYTFEVKPDDFCSRAERKDDDCI